MKKLIMLILSFIVICSVSAFGAELSQLNITNPEILSENYVLMMNKQLENVPDEVFTNFSYPITFTTNTISYGADKALGLIERTDSGFHITVSTESGMEICFVLLHELGHYYKSTSSEGNTFYFSSEPDASRFADIMLNRTIEDKMKVWESVKEMKR